MSDDLGSGDVRGAQNPFSILLVEDDKAHAMLIMRVFERLGFSGEIDWVRDGKAALDHLRERETSLEDLIPRLVILDLRLPKLDGHQVLSEMKRSERLRIIPVVVLTTSTSEDDLMKAYSNHVNSYISKPLRLEDLHRIVENIKKYWLECNRYPKPS